MIKILIAESWDIDEEMDFDFTEFLLAHQASTASLQIIP
jgi:CMP-N-acetylneuraminic acid synthetase